MTRRLALALLLAVAGPVAAQTPLPGRGAGDAPAGEMLRIPGLPPIPMPPGARVYGPESEGDALDRELRHMLPRPAQPRAATPAEAAPPKPEPQKPAQRLPAATIRKNVLDDLFKRLASARDLEEAQGIEGAIERVWLRSGSDTADLLMSRALTAWQGKDFRVARSLLDRIVALEPNWAEGWNKRATLRFLTDDAKGSRGDAERALLLEPRHYGALAGLALILEQTGDKKRALEALRKAKALNPRHKDIADKVEKLRLEVEGQDI